MRVATAGLLAAVLSGCGPRELLLPSGDGVPFPGFAERFALVTESCRGIRSLTAELSLSGRTGATRVRGRVLAGIQAPDSIRLEGVAPFGAPGFILAAAGGRGALLLPRDGQVLLDESPEAILGALIGLPLRPAELLALATGCVSSTPEAVAGRTYPGGWIVVDLVDGATAYLREGETTPRLVAATLPGLVVEYRQQASGLPTQLRVRSSGSAAVDRAPTDLTIGISQTETNRTLPDAVFEVDVPMTAVSITLEQLRQTGPLGVASP